MSLKRLRVDWATLTLDDFVVSDTPCDCRLEAPHYKLAHGDDLVCPVSLGIQWARLKLNGVNVTDFNIADNIEKSKRKQNL